MNGKKDCEKLMNALLPLADKMLQDHGQFYPYGGYMKPSGEIVEVGAQDEDTDYPKSQDLLHVLRDSFSDMGKSGGCRATALVFDARVDFPETAKKTNAIQVCIEHIDGYSAEIFFPYEIRDSRLNYGVTFAQEGKREIFGKSQGLPS